MLEAVENALRQDGEALLDAAAQAQIRNSMDALRAVTAGSNHQAIKRAVEVLNLATTEFAQRRMDQSVKSALTGHKLSDLES